MPTTNTGASATSISAPDLGGASFSTQGVVEDSHKFSAASKGGVLDAASMAVDVGGQLALDADAGFANAQLEGNINNFLEQSNPETHIENQQSLFGAAAENLTKINARLDEGEDSISNSAPELKKTTDMLLKGAAQGLLTPREVELRTKEATRDAISRRPGLARELTQHAERTLNLSGIRDRENLESDLSEMESKRAEKAYNDVLATARKNDIPFDRLAPNIQDLNEINQKMSEERAMFENMKNINSLSDSQKEQNKASFVQNLPKLRQSVVTEFTDKANELMQGATTAAERSQALESLASLKTSFINFTDSVVTDARIDNPTAAPHRAQLEQQLGAQLEAITANSTGKNIADFAGLNSMYLRSVQESNLRSNFDVATTDMLSRMSQGVLGLMLQKNPQYQENMTQALGFLSNGIGNTSATLNDLITSEQLKPGVPDLAVGIRGILDSSTPMPNDSEAVRDGKSTSHFENAVESVSVTLIDNPQGISSENRFKLLQGLVMQLSEPGAVDFLNNTSDVAKQKLGNLYDQFSIVLTNRADVAMKKAEDQGATVNKKFSPDGRMEFVVSHKVPNIQRELSNRLNNGVGIPSNQLIKGFGALFGEGAEKTRDVIQGKFNSKQAQTEIAVGSDKFMDKLVQVESNGDANAEATTSNAVGLTQFVPATWNKMIDKFSPELKQGKTAAEILELRKDPELSKQMAARLAEDNGRILGNSDIETTDGNLYLAHFLGVGTAVNVLTESPDTPLSDVIGQAAIKANSSVMKGKTVADLIMWSKRKMGEE